MASTFPGLAVPCAALAAFGLGCGDGPKPTQTYDQDGDGFEVGVDCNDLDDDVNPDALEDCGNAVDEDCDGSAPSCVVDQDGDGFEAADDCADNEASINPDAAEDCHNSRDDNCDGIATECIEPTLVYTPTDGSIYDPYAATIYADMAVFGDPSVGPSGLDGRALFFDVEEADVDETDAVILSEGIPNVGAAYGIVLTRPGGDLCIGSDYHSEGPVDAVGKSYCFTEATVRGAGSVLAVTDADYTVRGDLSADYAALDSIASVDGDGFLDLIVYTSHGIHVVLGDAAEFSGDYVVPRDATYTLGDCASSTSGWCGFARALNGITFAVAGEGGMSSIPIYRFTEVTPIITTAALRAQEDSMAPVQIMEGTFAVGSSVDNLVTFVDSNGVGDVLNGPPADVHFGYWIASTFDQEGDELILVSSPQTQYGNSQGLVYAFNVSQNGLPTSADQAVYILEPPEGFGACGSRTGAGMVTNDSGSYTAVASACPVSGGAVYLLDSRPPPAPFVGPNDIQSEGAPNTYRIRSWVVDAFTNNFGWLNGLAQTEIVRNGAGAITGWRLHRITSGSPLHRAGLRTGDVMRRVNSTNLTSPAIVTNLFSAFADADSLSIGITRNGANRTLHYQVVP